MLKLGQRTKSPISNNINIILKKCQFALSNHKEIYTANLLVQFIYVY